LALPVALWCGVVGGGRAASAAGPARQLVSGHAIRSRSYTPVLSICGRRARVRGWTALLLRGHFPRWLASRDRCVQPLRGGPNPQC